MPNSPKSSPGSAPAPPPSPPVVLSVRGWIPAFKTGKQAAPMWRPGGKLIHFVRTKPEHKERMAEITAGFVSQLLCMLGRAGLTPMDSTAQSWIASRLPCDDSAKWLAGTAHDYVLVGAGEDGAVITITQEETKQ